LRKWVSELMGVNVFLFGYKRGVPFRDMPKIHINISREKGMAIYDQTRHIFVRTARFKLQGKYLVIRFPLARFNNPNYILACVRTHFGGLPFEATAWRVLRLE